MSEPCCVCGEVTCPDYDDPWDKFNWKKARICDKCRAGHAAVTAAAWDKAKAAGLTEYQCHAAMLDAGMKFFRDKESSKKVEP